MTFEEFQKKKKEGTLISNKSSMSFEEFKQRKADGTLFSNNRVSEIASTITGPTDSGSTLNMANKYKSVNMSNFVKSKFGDIENAKMTDNNNFTVEDVQRRIDLQERKDVAKQEVQNDYAVKQQEEAKEQERWNNLSFGEKIVDPFKTMGANIKYGNLGIEESQAWSEYRNKQDAESLAKAQQATKAREEYEASNDRIGKGNALTKDFAQYMPQLGGQLKSGLGGAAAGAGAGAAGGAGIALAAGQLGPQVLVPEEIATIPAGALTGAIWGGRGGYVAGTAKYSYDLMAGSAYKTLLDMGVPNDVALELSGDEAIINSLIEGGGAIVDLISLGIGKLGTKGATTATKKVAQNRLLAAAKAYGLNLATEPLEEMAQEKVSIETEKKAADISGIERQTTESQDAERIKEAGIGALKVSAIAGIGNAGGNIITNKVSDKIQQNQINNQIKQAEIRNDIKDYKANSQYGKYIPQNQVKGTEIAFPQKSDLRESPTNDFQGQGNHVTLPTEKDFKRNKLIAAINSNRYLTADEKASLVNQVNESEYTEEIENGMQGLLKSVNEELGLKNISNNFKENKPKYTQYANDNTEYDTQYIDNAKNAINSNKSGRRTKEQWLQVAKNLGSQIYEMSDAEIERLAYKTWIDNKPNNKENLNRQGQKYVKFGLDEWINTVYDTVRDARNRVEETTVDTLPTQKAQETLQSAKLVGMSNMDMKRAIGLNNMLQSGAKLKFYDANHLPEGAGETAKIANGFYLNGTLWINKNSQRQVEKILGHELTHYLEKTSAYNDFANAILDNDIFYDYITSLGYTTKEDFKNNLRKRGYSDDVLDSEMVAMFIEDNLFNNQESINRLARENRTLAQKIKNWLSDMILKVKGTSQEKELIKIENMYKKALEQARNSENTASDTKYSFAGINAKNAEIGKLKEAENLEKNDVSVEEIYRQTGWYRGNEGKWRFEIDDSNFNLKTDVKLEENKEYKLSDILIAPELFEAYPELSDMKMIFEDMEKGEKGFYRRGSNPPIIMLSNDLISDSNPLTYEMLGLKYQHNVYSTLMHEIQHFIQTQEGFSSGSSIEKWNQKRHEKMRDAGDKVDSLERRRKFAWEQLKKEIGFDEKVNELSQIKDAEERADALETYRNSVYNSDDYKIIAELDKKIKDAENEYYAWDEKNPGLLYKNTAGEQEARNVQERINMSSEEKKKRMPLVKTLATVYAEDNGISYSIGGEEGMKNFANNQLTANYKKAIKMSKQGYTNNDIIEQTGWFKDKNGDWKFEFTDKYMKLKENVELYDNETYKLKDILEHELLFEIYPQLADYKLEFENLDGQNATFISPTKTILVDPNKVITIEEMEGTLIHEIQHAIQKIEGFEKGRNRKRGGIAYYRSLGEIEAADVRNRYEQEKAGKLINENPISSQANPTHPNLDRYLKTRTEDDIIKDEKYLRNSELKNKIKDGIYNFLNKEGYDEATDEFSAQKDKQDIGLLDRDGLKSEADKQSAFSMSTDNKGRKLSENQQEYFKNSKIRDDKGRLIEVYHRTNQDFTEFDRNKIGSATDDGLWGSGFYFSNLDHKHYGKNVIKGYLNITNPLVMRDFKSIQEIAEYLDIVERNFHYEPDGLIRVSYDQIRQFTSHVIEKGHDGVIAEHDNGVCEYVIFEPNQIKEVTNTEPTEKPDIRYSKNPVDIAKNPPNPQTGLDALKRAGKENVGDSQSSFIRNIKNQNIFDDHFKELAWNDKNIRTYESISNKETMQQANDAINEQGQKWVDRFLDKSSSEMKATDIAGGFILMNRYQQVGDYESMIRVAEKLRKAGTQQGQTIQLFSVLGRMTPEGMTYYAQKTLSDAYDEILKNKTQKWADEHKEEFKLNDKDIDFIQRRVNQAAKLPEGRDKYILLGEIAEKIQGKIPPQAGQSVKALARISMLLNPKTMVRNVLGNVVIAPYHIVSDFVGTGIDKAISNKTGARTTGTFDIKSLKGVKKGFYESFDDFRRGISTKELGANRYEIQQVGKSFNELHTGKFAAPQNALAKALNGLDRVTGFLLESGDRPFFETWFINSLNNQMELNNAVKPTAEMIQIATDDALQRTWQDNNTYTNIVSSVRRNLNKLNIKGYGFGDITTFFVKTPANLTKAIVDFSPLGAINALIKTSQFNKNIGKGIATARQQREVVKAWSQVITGTLGMAIMTGLANAGILGGGSDEDKDVRNFEQNILGIKPYSIKIGDKSFTYDWAQPLGTSAAIVADITKSIKNSKEGEKLSKSILKGLESGAKVFLNQSFVSGIRGLFEDGNLISGIIDLLVNEPAKFTPQFLSQIAQTQDDTARTSYVYDDKIATGINKVKAKIPGLRQTLEPSVDVLGREVKTDNSVGNVMFNPANTAFARSTKGAEEMYRVYQATGDKAAIAQVAPYYFNVGSEKIVLTPQQRTKYQKTTGKIASDGVENLLKNNSYKSLPDEDKAEILKDLYSYGNAIAKEEASKKYLLPKEMQKIKDSGKNPEEYILMKYIANSGGLKKDEMYNALNSSGYSKNETEEFLADYKGYKFESTSNNTLPTLASQRAKLPSLKK